MNFFTCIANEYSEYREFIFWPTIPCGLAIEGDWLEFLPARFLRAIFVVASLNTVL